MRRHPACCCCYSSCQGATILKESKTICHRRKEVEKEHNLNTNGNISSRPGRALGCLGPPRASLVPWASSSRRPPRHVDLLVTETLRTPRASQAAQQAEAALKAKRAAQADAEAKAERAKAERSRRRGQQGRTRRRGRRGRQRRPCLGVPWCLGRRAFCFLLSFFYFSSAHNYYDISCGFS